MLNQNQKDTVVQWIATGCDIAEVDAPGVSFALKGGVAGDYNTGTNLLRINNDMCSRHFDDFKNTALHELAHHIDYVRHGNRKSANGKYIHHDVVFRNIMYEIGATDVSTTHKFTVVKSRVYRKFLYECACTFEDGSTKGHEVTTILHNKMQKKGASYQCLKCGKGFNKNSFLKEIK